MDPILAAASDKVPQLAAITSLCFERGVSMAPAPGVVICLLTRSTRLKK